MYADETRELFIRNFYKHNEITNNNICVRYTGVFIVTIQRIQRMQFTAVWGENRFWNFIDEQFVSEYCKIKIKLNFKIKLFTCIWNTRNSTRVVYIGARWRISFARVID